MYNSITEMELSSANSSSIVMVKMTTARVVFKTGSKMPVRKVLLFMMIPEENY